MTEENEKEEFTCWVCEEKLTFNKLVNHLRSHTELEKRIEYNKQRKAELAEMEKKHGKGKNRPPPDGEQSPPLQEEPLLQRDQEEVRGPTGEHQEVPDSSGAEVRSGTPLPPLPSDEVRGDSGVPGPVSGVPSEKGPKLDSKEIARIAGL